MKNGRSSESGGIIPELIKCGKEYLGKYLLQLINSCLEQNKISSGKNFMWHHYIKKEKGKILKIIRKSVSIIPSVDCFSGLFVITCRKS